MSAKKTSTKKSSVKKVSAKKKASAAQKSMKRPSAKKKIVKKVAKKKTATKKVAAKAVKRVAVKKSVAKKAAPRKSSSSAVNLKVGEKAPSFSLQNQNGQTVSLKDFTGKQHVVLYFYPKAMTPGCTVQACGLRDSADTLRQAGAVALGVSPDKVPALTKFRERDQLNFDLLSDENKTLAKSYGVWGLKKFMGREFMGVRRWTFIIGKDGTIKHIMDQVNTATHHDDVLAILKTL